MSIKEILEKSDTKSGRAFDFFIQGLIVISLITFSVETLPNLSEATRIWLYRIEVATVLIFTCEYLARLIVADQRLKFAFSFFGIVDLIAIIPFYLSLGIDLRSVRAFRMLRLFRMFKLARYSKALRRFHIALGIAKEELVLFACFSAIILYLASVGIYHFENHAQPQVYSSVFHSLWWAICTLTTVGYGDIYPITVGGKIFTFAVLLVGLGIISVPAGLISSSLSKAREIEAMESHTDEHLVRESPKL